MCVGMYEAPIKKGLHDTPRGFAKRLGASYTPIHAQIYMHTSLIFPTDTGKNFRKPQHRGPRKTISQKGLCKATYRGRFLKGL